MRSIVAGSGYVAALVLWSALGAQGYEDKGKAEPPRGGLDDVAKAYKIEIVSEAPTFPVKTRHGAIDGKRADEKAVQVYGRLFADELSLYPASLVRRTGLVRVVLCRELSFAGQLRNGIPDFEHNTLYFDVVRGAFSKRYLRKVIHHELFHIIDWRDDGRVYEDERWTELNKTDFKYGTGGKNAQEVKGSGELTDKYPGFLNHYSTTGVEEDKAEVFAHMIAEAAFVQDRIKTDRVLKSKVERMKVLVADFCPDLNENFWEKVRAMKRPDEK